MMTSQRTDLRNRAGLILPILKLAGQVLLPQSVTPLPRARLHRQENLSSPEIPELFLAIPALLETGNSLRSRENQTGTESGIGCLVQVETLRAAGDDNDVVLLRGIGRGRFQRQVVPKHVSSEWNDRLEENASLEQRTHRRTDPAGRSPLGVRRLSPPPSEEGLAEVQLLSEIYETGPEAEQVWLRQQLIQLLEERSSDLIMREMCGLLESELPLGHLCDLAAPALGIAFDGMCELLNEHRVESRCRAVLRMTAERKPAPTVRIPGPAQN